MPLGETRTRARYGRDIVAPVARLFLSIWLAAFALQASDFLTIVAPDTCTEDVRGSAADPCQDDGCPRCVCGARVPAFTTHVSSDVVAQEMATVRPLPPLDPSTTPSPRGIFHVPKHS